MNPPDPTTPIVGDSPPVEPARAILLLYLGTNVLATRLEPMTAVVVGRDPTVDVVVPDASVSKRHACLTFDGNHNVSVEDLGSTNGTICKGHKIQKDKPITVTHGAEIYFGALLGIIHIPDAQVVANSREETAKTDALEGDIIADAPAMKRALDDVEQFARASATVVITGETGTGKDEIAKLIHRSSARSDKPFVVLNCAAIASHLLESTLFGHEKGAFTGAFTQKKGYFEDADGGTLLLDEIGELSPDAQKALLRVLETGKITRVGSVREIPVDVRVIAATWRDLKKMCEQGKFRWDLYHRICVLTIDLPPLRERQEDLAKLVGRFLQRANKSNGRAVKGIEDDALRTLMAYRWPGNIRELRNWIDRAVVVTRSEKITTADLPAHIEGKPEVKRNLPENLEKYIEALEKEFILEALRQTGGDTAEAARRVGMDLRTLQRRMKKYGIVPKPRGKI